MRRENQRPIRYDWEARYDDQLRVSDVQGKESNTHKHQNRRTEVHQLFHRTLEEGILTRVRMLVRTVVADPRRVRRLVVSSRQDVQESEIGGGTVIDMRGRASSAYQRELSSHS